MFWLIVIADITQHGFIILLTLLARLSTFAAPGTSTMCTQYFYSGSFFVLYCILCCCILLDFHCFVHSYSSSLVTLSSLQIENTCFSLTFFGEGYSEGTDPSQGRPNSKICTQVIGPGKTAIVTAGSGPHSYDASSSAECTAIETPGLFLAWLAVTEDPFSFSIMKIVMETMFDCCLWYM